jgi:hypothetical protein
MLDNVGVFLIYTFSYQNNYRNKFSSIIRNNMPILEVELKREVLKLLKEKLKVDPNDESPYYTICYGIQAELEGCLMTIKSEKLAETSQNWQQLKDKVVDKILACEAFIEKIFNDPYIMNKKLVHPESSRFDKALVEYVSANPKLTIEFWWRFFRKYQNTTLEALEAGMSLGTNDTVKLRSQLLYGQFDVIEFDESSNKTNHQKAVIVYVNENGDQEGNKIKISYDFTRKKIKEIQRDLNKTSEVL